MKTNSKNKTRKKYWFLVFVLFISFLLILFYQKKDDPGIKKNDKEKIIKKEIFTDFNNNKFIYGQEGALLAELGICDTTIIDGQLGSCSPSFFRFFKLNAQKNLSQGFILLVNGSAYNDPEAKFPIRRTMVFEREGKKLVSVNKFKGNIIETRDVPNSDYHDIVIRFRIDEYNEAYHVVYTWKDKRYHFSHCEELYSYYNKGKIRKEMVDSVSKQVEKIILEEKLVF